MSDDEVIPFDITDYDLENEFNPNRNRRPTKEQQIYGVWARDSEEENNENPQKAKKSRKPKDFSAPIGFIAGGVQQAGKKKSKKEITEESLHSEDENSQEPITSSRQVYLSDSSVEKEGERTKPTNRRRHRKKYLRPQQVQISSDDDSNASDDVVNMKQKHSMRLGSSFPKTADYDSDEEAPNVPNESEMAGMRKKGPRAVSLSGNVGAWEKHTKGIGAKLLLQMGYKPGKGLGKDLQGISAPVEATVRKGRGAIGAYGPEKSAQKAKEAKLKAEEQNKLEIEVKKTYNWKKNQKTRYFYKNAADIVEGGDNKQVAFTETSEEATRVPVIDMTGKERRVLSGYHALGAASFRFEHEPRRKCQNFASPQLLNNMDQAVHFYELEIIRSNRILQQLQDHIVTYKKDIEVCRTALKEGENTISRVKDILAIVDKLKEPEVSLETAYEILDGIKQKFPEEYEAYGLGPVAVNIISPLISALLATWDPLIAPIEPKPTFLKWRKLLNDENYNNLLWQQYVSRLNIAIEMWNPRDPMPMLQALTSWADTCPAWMISSCVSRNIVPRILTVLQMWDPIVDTQPLHQWILPWHEYAASALASSVYPLIRTRLIAALACWHPADSSARRLLGAWADTWGPDLTTMLHQHIVPKLEHCLSQTSIEFIGRDNNANAAWSWCLEWVDLIGAPTVAAIAMRSLLPRWLAALAAWLNDSPEHCAVLHAYTSFKEMFPENISREPAVHNIFMKALDMINRSIGIDPMEPAPPPPYFISSESQDSNSDVLSITNQQKSFTELLESRCLEKGITFVPIAGKTRDGRPLYQLGNYKCYIIRNVIMYSDDNGKNYAPISMERLLNQGQ